MKHLHRFLLSLTLLFISNWALATVQFEQDRSLPIVYLNIVANVGAVHDPADKQGLALIAGNMFLRGTKNHDKLAFLSLIDRLGASINVDVRAEGIVFRVAALSERLNDVLNAVSEAFLTPAFKADELQKLKSEAIGSILAERGNDARLAARHFQRFLFGSHPYGNSINGTEKGVLNIAPTDVHSFYSRYFGSRSLTVFGSGDSSTNTIEKWWDQLTKRLDAVNPKAARASRIEEPRLTEGRRVLIVDKPQSTQSQIMLGYKGPRPSMDGFYTLQIANQAYGGHSFQSTLMKEVREKRGWTYNIANNFRYALQPYYFATNLFPKTADTIPAIKLVISLFEDHIDNGVSQADFDFFKQTLVSRAPFNYDTARKRLENATAEYLYEFPKGYFKDFASRIASVSFEDSGNAIKNIYDARNITIVIVGKAKDLAPQVKDLPGFGAPEIKPFNQD